MLDAGDRLVLIEWKDVISQDYLQVCSCAWELQRVKWIDFLLPVGLSLKNTTPDP